MHQKRENKMEIPKEAVEQAKLFFFRAMRQALSSESGWSGQTFSHQEGGLRFSGMLKIVNDSNSTVLLHARMDISFRGTQIWSMHCDGRCRKRDLPFLRHVLLHSYARREFIGGRGQIHYERGLRAYGNRPFPGRFEAFCGSEKVHKVPSKGSAVYQVTSLLSYAGGLVHG
ncbi:MAG: hypothetical protein WC790_00630 [Candidatus Paceibacterota bacterium]|jgi:hypothetical protein